MRNIQAFWGKQQAQRGHKIIISIKSGQARQHAFSERDSEGHRSLRF